MTVCTCYECEPRPRLKTKGRSELERFTAFVHVEPTGCWRWVGKLGGTRRNYGYFGIAGTRRHEPAHRAAWRMFRGPIPDGLQVDHMCRRPPCVNPAHLRVVTPRENLLAGDGWSGRNARKTHCVNGHPFDDHNTYRGLTGRRCRACQSTYRRTPTYRAKHAVYERERRRRLRAAA